MEVIVNGQPVFVATGGAVFDPTRPVLLLVHGAGHDHTAWAQQSRALAHSGFAVLAPDLPGHGRSAGEALATVPRIAQWLADLLQALDVGRATVAGHSLGALAALHLAAHHPERVNRLFLLGAAAALPVHPDLLAAARDDLPKAAEMIVGWGFAHKLAPSPVPGLSPSQTGRALLLRSRPGTLHAGLAACADYQDGAQAAALVRAPTVLIHGTQDRMAPLKAGRALAQSLTDGRLAEIHDAGHMVQAESPGAVLAALRQG